ncbi:thiaminase II [Paenibacillus whitsoniae]|uniref:Aminopyrimidine aminohydrolase n=1 Tax=Paenibacillus whitsoniae TaxID=2496558 RepID=A0A3S0A425_9BACL|nr:thiaminase II [Paenibacillus whitsoniae]RTE09108.1 thiaminase II [Paenibacillus whitsoniae]
MSFTKELREAADPIFEAIYQHPFVQGIARGALGKEQLIHYVKQDFEYLNAYMRVYGLGISKCRTREEIAKFHEKIGYILHSEVHPHNNFCHAAGVTYEELQGYPLAPTAQHYTRHMLTVAAQGTLGEIYAVLLPCPWTYMEAAQRILQDYQPQPDHPFYEWITFYGSPEAEPRMMAFCAQLDAWAVTASEEEKRRMREHFMISCQLEYMFFDMAYRVEDWPVPERVLV